MSHVAFVALTGFRIHERRMLELGMSLPGFERRGQAIAGLPALGLLTLAGMTPEHFSRSWHEARSVCDAMVAEILATKPTLVAVSALTASIDEAYTLCAALRANGAKVVVGGLHATALPDEVALHADAVVVGDGEPVWLDVLRDAERGALRARYQAAQPFDLGESPVPAFALLGDEQRPRFTLQSERGCPFACEFCAASRVLGPFREKPIDRIRAELEAICAIDPRPLVELADDNTFAGARDPRELLDVLGEFSVRYFTEADWRIGERPELLAALAQSGCRQVLVGIESLVTRHPGMGKKQADMQRVIASIDAIQAHGIVVNGCFIVGADGETRQSLDRLGDFALASSMAEVQITLQTPFPGSALHARLQREGRLLADRGWRHHTLFDLTYEPDKMSVRELEAGYRELLARVYAPEPAAERDRRRRAIWKVRREVRS